MILFPNCFASKKWDCLLIRNQKRKHWLLVPAQISVISFLACIAVALFSYLAFSIDFNKMAPKGNRMSETDPTSYSEPEKCVMKHLNWNVRLDFEAHTISGVASLYFEKKTDELDLLLLDIRDLNIDSVKLQDNNQNLSFGTDDPAKVDYGSRLWIQLPVMESKSFTVDIAYSTSENSTALCWMTPQQTAGKRQPYLYSQCQAIHARSLYPCQDTPAVKFTYKAEVEAPKEITVLMSANRGQVTPGSNGHSTTSFSLEIPIPSYLLAIVAGDLESRDIGPRSKVWSEKEFVDKAAFEFAETESMLQVAEDLMGPYVWGQYDLLVLPPSFPYGGMENPCLTFVTPTLLAGDRSLVSVVAHEISHSWTGNLVTNANFEHFWLNEGHTVFLERKIHGKLNGEAWKQIHANEGWTGLKQTIKVLTEDGHAPYTQLVPDLCGVDPDEAFSKVPYEKGYALLQHLENLLGGPDVFNVFLKAYIEHFKYKSILTKDWKDFLFGYFSSAEDQKRLATVDWDKWLYGEGVPPFEPNYDLSLAQASRDLSKRWINASSEDTFSPEDTKDMASDLVNNFLSSLLRAQPPLPLTKVQQLESVYHFNEVKNSEILFTWLQLCIQAKWTDAIQHVLNFVNEQGRMKFVIPLYRSMNKWDEGRKRALENFNQHKAEMHSTTAKKVEDIFK